MAVHTRTLHTKMNYKLWAKVALAVLLLVELALNADGLLYLLNSLILAPLGYWNL